MPNSVKTECSVRIIQKEVRHAESMSIDYILCLVTTQASRYYAVEIVLGEETDMQMLGGEDRHAHRLFEILVNEFVTPCTLADVLYDMRREENDRLHLQNLCKM